MRTYTYNAGISKQNLQVHASLFKFHLRAFNIAIEKLKSLINQQTANESVNLGGTWGQGCNFEDVGLKNCHLCPWPTHHRERQSIYDLLAAKVPALKISDRIYGRLLP